MNEFLRLCGPGKKKGKLLLESVLYLIEGHIDLIIDEALTRMLDHVAPVKFLKVSFVRVCIPFFVSSAKFVPTRSFCAP